MSSAGAPATAPDDAAAAPPTADTSADANAPSVLLTVMDNHDGSYTLVEGDEQEPGEGGDMAEGGGEPAGKTFDSIGALLKGVLDVLKNNDEGQGEFDAGFEGGSSASPPKAKSKLPPQKY